MKWDRTGKAKIQHDQELQRLAELEQDTTDATQRARPNMARPPAPDLRWARKSTTDTTEGGPAGTQELGQ